MELQDFIEFDELYFENYPSWGEAPATVWSPNEVREFEVKEEADSPYDLMREFAVYGVMDKAILAIRGWGAPIDPETGVDGNVRPSEHPERKRLALYMYFDENSEKLTIAVHGEGDDLMVMHDEGAGALADVAYECIANVKDVVTNLLEIEAEA